MEKEDVTMELATEVKHYRENEGLDVRSVSEVMGISMQDVTKIINSDIYQVVRAEPANNPAVIVEEGIPDSEFSEKRLEEVLDQAWEWGVEFSKSEYFEELTDEQKRHSEFITQSFAEFMYSYYGLQPEEWGERTIDGGLEECCTWVFPKRITADQSCFESIAPVLSAFFSFAGEKGLLNNASELVERVQDIEREIVENASNPKNWGLAKSFLMIAKEAGVDIEDEQELNDFLKSCGARPLVQPRGRNTHWTREDVRELSTEQIVQKLRNFGVEFKEKQFLEDVNNFYSACELADHWWKIYPITATGYDEDFIWMAAIELWKRLAPDVISSEQLDDMMQKGYELLEEGKKTEACALWLEVWDHLKERFTPDMKSIQDAERVFSGLQSLYNWCQDMEMELWNAGVENSSFHKKRIEYCQEFCDLFPETESLIIHNMKGAVARSHYALGRLEEGEEAFKALVKEFPGNAWSYIKWGDMYWLIRPNEEIPLDYEKAEEIYRMALNRDVEDEDVILSRLRKLEEEKEEHGEL